MINLRARFGLQRLNYDNRTRLVVINTDSRVVGFIVDTAREFLAIPTASIHPPPEKLTNLSGKYLQGVAQLPHRLILILNVQEILKLSNLDSITTTPDALVKQG